MRHPRSDKYKLKYTGFPTRYQTRHFFSKSNTNEDIVTEFEQEYVRCVRNEEECVCSAIFAILHFYNFTLVTDTTVQNNDYEIS